MNKISVSRIPPIFIIGVLFFIFGFITWLNSTLVPFLKISCELNNFESYFVTFVFYIAYFVFAIPSSRVIDKVGYRTSISIGLWIMASGALFFIPAAIIRYYGFFLTGLFLMGAGLALLQTAANPYVAILGSPQTAARRISIMGVCNKTAGVLAPLLLGSAVLPHVDAIISKWQQAGLSAAEKSLLLDSLAQKCIFPYVLIIVFLLLLAFMVRFSNLPDVGKDADEKTDGLHFFSRPRLWGGVIALFFYVGAEVISVDSLIGYATGMGMSSSSAKVFPALSMITFILGYLVGIAGIPRLFSQRTALIFSAAGCLLVSIVSIVLPGLASVYVLVWLGFTNAMIWPAVWALAIEGLGKYTSLGASFLIMAIVGGALIPLLFGYLIDVVGFQSSYWILVPCYLYIFLYGVSVKHRDAV